MSDKQKKILFTLEQYFPEASKRFSCRHIYANLKTKYPDSLLKKKFWATYKTGNARHFNEIIEEVKEITEAGYDYLIKIPIGN